MVAFSKHVSRRGWVRQDQDRVSVQFGLGLSVAPIDISRHTNTSKSGFKKARIAEWPRWVIGSCRTACTGMPFFQNPRAALEVGLHQTRHRPAAQGDSIRVSAHSFTRRPMVRFVTLGSSSTRTSWVRALTSRTDRALAEEEARCRPTVEVVG
jgi:hypothetical protein